jgi:iron complex transport system substrate-binding protein
VETVLTARPDLILDYRTINPTYVSLADRIQKQIGVPYLLFDGSFEQIPAIYKSAGAALGVESGPANCRTMRNGYLPTLTNASHECHRRNGR